MKPSPKFSKSVIVAAALLPLVAAILAGCASPRVGEYKEADLRRWYVAAEDATKRGPVPYESVAFSDSVPARKHHVVGYVCPPAGRFRSWGELLNATRAAASLYGANAVYVDQQKEFEGWGFSVGQWGGGGGKWRTVQIRATAVVWDN